MIEGYSKNKSIQILIALLKEHNIKRVIISPGTTNLEFVSGLQYEGSFKLYSSVDERSAAYMACGMATELNEPVVITCTEATASRNYFSGLTEAYHRKLPIIAITGVHRYNRVDHLEPQTIDRSISPNDIFKLKVHLPIIKDKEDIWETEIKVNKALLEVNRHGGGPVHIDLPCCNEDYDFSTKVLPKVNVIKRYVLGDKLPDIPNGKIAIFIGSHRNFTINETEILDKFCATYNAIVICDHTSGYEGKYQIKMARLSIQRAYYEIFSDIELLIHMGEESGDGATMTRLRKVKRVWRVSPDGELRDTFKKLKNIFEMNEYDFLANYIKNDKNEKTYLLEMKNIVENIKTPIEKIPFSNIYVAAMLSSRIPENSTIHLGVSNTIRAWSLFDFPKTVNSSSNVGCRGIDGALSSLVGASLINEKKLYFCVLGDLSFFYDMNALGNRFIKNNIRILLINNNGGGVFKLNGAPGHTFFGDEETNKFIAASGHFGNKSSILVKNYVESLNFEYMCATNKNDFEKVYRNFVNSNLTDKPIVFELFINDSDDRLAFEIMSNIEVSTLGKTKKIAKNLLGRKGTNFIKNIIK